MRKKSTKLLALLTAGITAASLLAGCGSGGSDNAGTTDQAQESETKTERHKDGDREMEREREGKRERRGRKKRRDDGEGVYLPCCRDGSVGNSTWHTEF